jgi:2',3'-cyclic-nucleotide 2'-phosphodiesterase (5'-nucleotidase family)
MYNRKFSKALTVCVTFIMIFSMLFTTGGVPTAQAAPPSPVNFTILQTNDFHGQLEAANADPNKISTPGMARTAKVINDIRTAKGAANVLLVDAGDEMQGSLLSNLGDGTATGKGIPTIATYNAMGYEVATFGNHEFDWGQVNLANRTTEATYPYVTANIVVNDTGNCSTAGWTLPSFADAPYVIKTMGTDPNTVKVAFIGLTTTETPTITVASATAGLCFKDPTTSIVHYYSQMKAEGADVIVVLSHLGYNDGGYGYGLPVTGDQTLAKNLINAGDPVNLIIGGHSHSSVNAPGTTVTVSGKTGSTLVTQAAYNGRRVGQADITVGTDGSVSISWKVTVWTQQNTPSIPASVWRTFTTSSLYTEITDVSKDPTIDALITGYATDPDYLALVNTPIGYSAVDLGRNQVQTNPGAATASYATMFDNMMGTFIDDAIYNYLNTDAEPSNDIDLFFNNAGGIRTDWCWDTVNSVWTNASCTATGTHTPGLLTYGHMFTVLPFGNATVVGQMTGAHILEVLNQGPLVSNGIIQVSGLKYKYFRYTDTLAPGSVSSPYPYAWGAYDVTVLDKGTGTYVPLDLTKTYNVGTNEFLAPAGGDGYGGFKYMTNITYWGDMLNAVNAYVTANYGTSDAAYAGPNADGNLDERIGLNGDGDFVYDAGEIVPLTILHHNDPHGNLYKNGTYAGITQLATLIKQEKAHNPSRTLLFNVGDSIQGDGMSFYFKSSYTGFAVDGTNLHSPPQSVDLTTDPIIAAMNALGYDAMTLGNHEFNFGSDVFQGVLGQATFPILDADVSDGAGGHTYGLAAANGGEGVQPYIEKTLDGIKIGILGLGNPRIPNYELPSNILGLTFANNLGVDDPITRGQTYADELRTNGDDVVVALTHLGFTDATDAWVDTYLASHTTGIDVIIGGHSHTDPTNTVAYPYLAPYKFLPGIWAAADGKTVAINTAYRYNYFLGEMVMGLRDNGAGGYDVVSQTGRNMAVCAGGKTGTGLTCSPDTVEDAATKALIDPYKDVFTNYNNTTVGQTTAPIDTLLAFTQETNGANLQADASVYELSVKHSIPVDFHLSGAMTNKKIADTATLLSPYTLKISDMFSAMPYENSLVVISMNGPQLKTVLERAYRNYYYYKYDPVNHGNYSYYTTCMLDTDADNRIFYKDTYPSLPDGNNVIGLLIHGTPVDLSDATTYYRVSTVNYLAAGSCNFNDSPGTSLWPLSQTVADTQYYVRDAVIDYTTFMGTVSPAIEGRLSFSALPFTISGNAGVAGATLSYDDGGPKTATADGSGNYSFQVSYDWSGTVTPSKTGYAFTPTLIDYTNVVENQAAQNYTANLLPEITSLSMIQSPTGSAPWSPVSGSLGSGYLLSLNGVPADFVYLDVDSLAANTTLKDGYHPFTLDTTGLPVSYYTYWDAKGVNAGATPGTWQAEMWKIINGDDPIFFLKVTGTNYMLVDGLGHNLGGPDGNLRISGDYPFGLYKFNGELTSTADAINTMTATMTMQPLPEITALSLEQSLTGTAPWSPVSGSLGSGYLLSLNGVPADFAYLNVDSLTSPTTLQDGYHPFTLNTTSLPSDFYTYWDAKGVNTSATPGTWQAEMWKIINGDDPIFFLKVAGSTYTLVDGLGHNLGGPDGYLRISGDYPLGLYTFDGVLTDTTGATNTMSADLTTQPLPEITALSMVQSPTGSAPWSSVSGSLGSGYQLPLNRVPSDFVYLNVDSLTSPTTLQDGYHPFTLNTTSLPSDFYTYWDAKGVNAGATPGTWQAEMWKIINGDDPIFFLKVAGSTYTLVDGLGHNLGGPDGYLRISGDYPLGLYTFDGVLTDTTGATNTMTATLTTSAITYTISGNAGVAGAVLSYDDGGPQTATAGILGDYSFSVPSNWSGTVTPALAGYTFLPPSRDYTNVLADKTLQDYTAAAITYTISGNAGVGGAKLSYTDGTPKTATADGSGNYSFSVSYDWTGTVTPSKIGYVFTPTHIDYTNVLANQTSQNYTATAVASFADVPTTYWSWSFIERLYAAGITGGCSGPTPLLYCPGTEVSRGQMAVFLERGMNGSSYTPPPATGSVFGDVPTSYWSASWVEKLFADGVTGGCGGGNYCPDQSVTRAQMAVFLLRAEHGSSYTPPPATGVFPDVPTSYWAASWIEQLYAESITGGCGGGNYCPDQAVTRDQMAVFLVRTFNLP